MIGNVGFSGLPLYRSQEFGPNLTAEINAHDAHFTALPSPRSMIPVRFVKQWLQHIFTPARRLALSVAFVVFLGFLSLAWRIDLWIDNRLYEKALTNLSAQVASYGDSVTQTFNQRVILVKGLSAFVVANAPSSPAEEPLFAEKFAIFADALYRSTDGIRNIALAPGGVVTYVYPYEENKSVIGYEPARDQRPYVRAEVQRAIDTGDIVLSLPYELVQGGTGIVIRQAIFIQGKYWGLANIVLDLPSLLADAGLIPPAQGLKLALKDQAGQVFFGEEEIFAQEPVLYTIELSEGSWTIAGVPAEGWGPLYASLLNFVRSTEIIIVILFTMLAYMITNRQARLTEHVQEKTQELSTALQALQESGERYRRLIESMNEGVLMVDNDNIIQMANPKFCEISGYSQEELIGANVEKLFQESQEAPEIVAFKSNFSSPVTQHRLRVRHRTGGDVWLTVNRAPIYDSQSNVIGSVGIYQDITKRKKAEKERDRLFQLQINVNRLALTLSEQHDLQTIYGLLYDHIAQMLPISAFILTSFDSDRKQIRPEFVCVNGTIRDVSAFPPEPLESSSYKREREVIRRGQPLYLPNSPEFFDPEIPTSSNSSQAAIIVPLQVEKRVIGALQVQGQAEAFSAQDVNNLAAAASVAAIAIQNITLLADVQRELRERQRTEEALQKLNTELEARVAERTAELQQRILDVEHLNRGIANLLSDLQAAQHKMEQNAARLQQANAELESFAYSISHDLRAPLRHISGFAELLRLNYEAVLDDTGQHYLQILQDSATRMDQLITGLLAFSRLGRKALNITAISTDSLVQKVWEQLRPEWQERAVDLVIGDLPDCRADAVLLEQVFTNLLSNALKYTRRREHARIEIGFRQIDEEGAYYVRDNGIGFDMKYADKLFGVFQRLHSDQEFEGTGVGLALSQRIIAKHGGRIWAEASPDQGATFYFTLDI